MPDYLQYELQSPEGIRYIRYPAVKATQLVVSFAAKGPGYNRLNHFWYDQSWPDTEFVFFCAGTNPSWYADYAGLVHRQVERFPRANVCFLGSSMGAYAALHYALRFNDAVGSVLLSALQAPPLAYKSDFLPEQHGQLWAQLQQDLRNCKQLPDLYIESTGAAADLLITRTILDTYMSRGGRFVAEIRPEDCRHRNLSFGDRHFTERCIRFLREWSSLDGI